MEHRTVLLHETVNALLLPADKVKAKYLSEVLPLPAESAAGATAAREAQSAAGTTAARKAQSPAGATAARKSEPAATPARDGVFVDCTFGRGGHSRLLLQHLAPEATLVVFDKDPRAIEVAEQLAQSDKRVRVVHDGFSTLDTALDALGIGQVQGVLMDLGVSSPQLDEADRGFSFMRDGPLDMRMDTTRGITAQEWLQTASVEEMTEVIKDYGEERYAFRIATAIADHRQHTPLTRTGELARLVASHVRTREKGQHPATRTFQAIRIYLNAELHELSRGLTHVLKRLTPGGRLAAISFHSLEDRLVKQLIQKASQPAAHLARLPIKECDMPQPLLTALGKYKASAHEVEENPRSRSAILRVAQRTATPLPDASDAWWQQLPQVKGAAHG